jgi:hypothetical protein
VTDDPFAVFRRRLAPRFAVDAWPVVVVKVVEARTLEGGARVPAHWMAAAWQPADEGPTRWPEAVVIGSPAADNALAELCARLPAHARLFLVDPDAVDASLAADILLAADRNLEPYHREGIAAFATAERARTAARIRHDYTDHDPGFARLLSSLRKQGPGDVSR